MTCRRRPWKKSDKRYPGNESKYAELKESDLPCTESLKDTVARCVPYWHGTIAPGSYIGKTCDSGGSRKPACAALLNTLTISQTMTSLT